VIHLRGKSASSKDSLCHESSTGRSVKSSDRGLKEKVSSSAPSLQMTSSADLTVLSNGEGISGSMSSYLEMINERLTRIARKDSLQSGESTELHSAGKPQDPSSDKPEDLWRRQYKATIELLGDGVVWQHLAHGDTYLLRQLDHECALLCSINKSLSEPENTRWFTKSTVKQLYSRLGILHETVKKNTGLDGIENREDFEKRREEIVASATKAEDGLMISKVLLEDRLDSLISKLDKQIDALYAGTASTSNSSIPMNERGASEVANRTAGNEVLGSGSDAASRAVGEIPVPHSDAASRAAANAQDSSSPKPAEQWRIQYEAALELFGDDVVEPLSYGDPDMLNKLNHETSLLRSINRSLINKSLVGSRDEDWSSIRDFYSSLGKLHEYVKQDIGLDGIEQKAEFEERRAAIIASATEAEDSLVSAKVLLSDRLGALIPHLNNQIDAFCSTEEFTSYNDAHAILRDNNLGVYSWKTDVSIERPKRVAKRYMNRQKCEELDHLQGRLDSAASYNKRGDLESEILMLASSRTILVNTISSLNGSLLYRFQRFLLHGLGLVKQPPVVDVLQQRLYLVEAKLKAARCEREIMRESFLDARGMLPEEKSLLLDETSSELESGRLTDPSFISYISGAIRRLGLRLDVLKGDKADKKSASIVEISDPYLGEHEDLSDTDKAIEERKTAKIEAINVEYKQVIEKTERSLNLLLEKQKSLLA